MGKVIPLQERFWAKVNKTDTCWLWTASLTDGYGRIKVAGKLRLAHIVAYEWEFWPVPEGLLVDHTCHVRHCVNAHHMRLVTNKQNCENRKGANRYSVSGVRGVSKHKTTGKWVAQLAHEGKKIHVGLFDTVAAAEYAVKMKRNSLYTHNDLDRSTP